MGTSALADARMGGINVWAQVTYIKVKHTEISVDKNCPWLSIQICTWVRSIKLIAQASWSCK